jgi:hypothetical protein
VLDRWCEKRRSITYSQREKECPGCSKNKANSIGHVLCTNCLLKYVVEGKIKGRIEVAGKQRRRGKQLLDDLTERTEYWKLEEEALDRIMWRTGFGSDCSLVARQTTKGMTNITRARSASVYSCHIVLSLPPS